MPKCENRRCPIGYPNWQEEEAAAKKKAECDRQDCVDWWRFYQKQAEAIVAPEDPITRNRRIDAAYANLWLDDRRFQWADLAPFASKQVGCGLLNAAELISRSNRERSGYQQWQRTSSPFERLSPYASPRMPLLDQATGEGATKVYQMLAKGNMSLFLDVWPLHMFYQRFGLQRFKRCLAERQELRGSVVWPIEAAVPFGAVQPRVVRALEAIDARDTAGGVKLLAEHEQLNALQRAMYDDPSFALPMRANQFPWALNIPTGSAREIQLTLANQCTVSGANAQIEVFSKQPLANLADPNQRMAFVMRAAQRFDDLLHKPIERHSVENSIFLIAHPR